MAATDSITGQSLDFSASPNSAVYAQNALGADQAYQTAMQNINARRTNMYTQAGFSPDGTSVDGTNLTGGYQQMMRAQGQGIENAHESALSRGIGAGGIAAQPGSDLRYGFGVQQKNFADNLTNNNAAFDAEGMTQQQNLWNTILQLQMQSISDARAAGTTGAGATTSSSGGGSGSKPGAAPPPGYGPIGSTVASSAGPGTYDVGGVQIKPPSSPVLQAAAALIARARPGGTSSNRRQGVYSIH